MAFQAGNSGNPHGRPKGSGQRQQLFNKLVTPHIDDLFNTAIQLALNGSEAMLRLFLERLLPTKAVMEPLNFRADTISESIQKLLSYVADGEMTAAEVHKISTILHKNKEIENQLILIRKLTALENRLKDSYKADIFFPADTNK